MYMCVAPDSKYWHLFSDHHQCKWPSENWPIY